MGTDIHAAIENRRDGVWRCVPLYGNFQLNIDRNYELFAVLAGVRNGNGFAGCQIFDPLVPLAPNRGLPANISAEARKACDGDHSATYVTLAELETLNLDAPIKHYGWVDAETFRRFRRSRNLAPNNYSGNVFGGRVRLISNRQMGEEILTGEADDFTYTRVTWRQTLRACAPQLEPLILREMRKVAEDSGAQNVRLVMNFDS